jgi:hypothetical protein
MFRIARHSSIKGYSGTAMWEILKIGRLKDNSLIITFTLPLGLLTVLADRLAFVALDSALPTGQTTSLGPLPRRARGLRVVLSRAVCVARLGRGAILELEVTHAVKSIAQGGLDFLIGIRA